MKKNQKYLDIKNLLDGICAINKWMYTDSQEYFNVSKRTIYLWRTKNKFSKNKLLNKKLKDLIKKSGKSVKEIIKVGKITNEIKDVPINKIIQFIVLNNKITLKQLSNELEIQRGSLSDMICKDNKKENVKQLSNFIAYKLGKYCMDNNFNLDFIKNKFMFDDLRSLIPEELTCLIYGLMKMLKINTYDFEKYGLKNNTICRWLLRNYKILQYKDISKLNALIKNSKITKDKLISIGNQVKNDITKLSKLLNCQIKTCNFKPKAKAEQELLSALKNNYKDFKIINHPKLYKKSYRFEPDFIVFNNKHVLWFEISEIKDTSSYPGNLDMRLLKIKELFKLDKVILIRKIEQNTNAQLRYGRILKLGINFCPINRINQIKGYLKIQDSLTNKIKSVVKNKITTGKDLRLFRVYCLHLSQEQLAVLLKIKNKRTVRLERKAVLSEKIIQEIENIKTIAKKKDVRFLHQKSNSMITKKKIQDENIIKFTDFKERLEKEIYELVKSKIEVYHNVILSNPEASIICEADLYMPSKNLVIACKNSVNPAYGTIHKLIWSLQRFKRIAKNVCFFVPNFPKGKEDIFKKYDITIVNNKKELFNYLNLWD